MFEQSEYEASDKSAVIISVAAKFQNVTLDTRKNYVASAAA